ncbi:uncharacterized protein DUF4062 [Vreelandella songnenensis]|uniref:Uncharacterized protein DUF4062 n=1 Tax=Vreelandella songnenensis TaxID=1176243 RepID=A0A2T0V098_9GAMM|nr:DUF4062 domain-containing protein [Halomonas songnenensis]PRY63518.1 uncharacterized protein DUF4062 [Halomonas songnenensis]
MSKGSKATLFVSSTCYDLSQVRADLRDFSESLGLEPILSEFNTFPVNPNQNTLSNCLEVVKSRADIFVLIVGGRYGSITDAGKSITNLEYFEAKAKGIPIYVFIKEDILPLIKIWKDNPTGDYSSIVDSPSLFEFVVNLRDSGDGWVFPFVNAQNIISTLREQLSYLLSDCLELRAKAQKSDPLIYDLEPKAFRLALEKPAGWEFLLFAEVLSDELAKLESKRLDSELGISFGKPKRLEDLKELTSWVSSSCSWISSTIHHISKALNQGFVKAVGEPGQSGDLKRIIHLAKRVGEGYEQLLDWKLQFLRVSCDDIFLKLIEITSNLSSNAIKEIEEFSESLYSIIENDIKSSEPGYVRRITLTLTVPDTESFFEEINRLKNLYGASSL